MPIVTPAFFSGIMPDGPRGASFLDSIRPPGYHESLHVILLNDTEDNPTLAELRQSFGHRVTAQLQKQLAEPHVHLLQKQHKLYGQEEFKKLNAKEITGGHRLQLIQDNPVGAALVVAQVAGLTPFITVVAAPTITPVNLSNQETFGAPSWAEAFDPQHLQQHSFPAGESSVTHGIIGSQGWKTRVQEFAGWSKAELIVATNPVLLTPDAPFRTTVQTVLHSAASGGLGVRTVTVQRVLLWLEFCSPPVG
eukprot:scaffold659_cov71-Cylindrotheca_fusiformis.AAC.4